MKSFKFSARQINNGWIIKVLNDGLSSLKTRYEKYEIEFYVERIDEIEEALIRIRKIGEINYD